MNLHRTSGKPDWVDIAPADRNVFQKMAAKSGGMLSPANIISFIGLGLVIYGLSMIIQGQYWWGLGLLAVGRLLDIVDGLVAEATRTKSPLGEMVDASIDKIGTVLTIVALFMISPADWWVFAALLVPQLLILAVVFYKRQQGVPVHPTRPGKLSMLLIWVALVGLLFAQALGYMLVLVTIVYAVAILSLVLGMYALWQYTTGRD